MINYIGIEYNIMDSSVPHQACHPMQYYPVTKPQPCPSGFDQSISPGWYYDMSQPPIAGHPVVASRHWECQIPNTPVPYNHEMMYARFDCSQPCWTKDCK